MTEPGGREETTSSVLRDLDAMASAACADCGRSLCGHEALMSRMLGFRDAPRCWSCLAGAVGRPAGDLRDHLQSHALHRDCYRAGWEEASRREGSPEPWRPPCLFPPGETPDPIPPSPAPPAASLPPPAASAQWDAGDMGCGDLVLELRLRLQGLPAGALLRVRATDPGAPEDLPAWCRLTGHRLLLKSHPYYWIVRKEC